MSKLPRIACFHGGGSNKDIFEIQCSQLEIQLKSEFEFHFFNGPFTRDAGPGVLPAFEGYEPFHNWFKVAEDGGYILLDGSGYDESGRDGIARVKMLMEARGGEWVGAIGFSQGTRVVAGLLLDQQRSIEQGNSDQSLHLKFGVLCNGGKEPMANVPEDPSKERIHIPTLHVHGLRDQYLEHGREQYTTYFDPSTAKLLEIDYHHAMPWKPAEVTSLAERIRELFQSAKDPVPQLEHQP